MNYPTRLPALVLLSLAIAPQLGCAAAFRGDTQTLHVDSDPQAEVRRGSDYIGKTPIDVPVSRQDNVTLNLHQQGYEDTQIHPHQHMSAGWAFWDIASCILPLTMCIPVAVDAISGAWFSYDETHHVKLLPSAPGTPAPPTAPTAPAAPTPASGTTSL